MVTAGCEPAANEEPAPCLDAGHTSDGGDQVDGAGHSDVQNGDDATTDAGNADAGPATCSGDSECGDGQRCIVAACGDAGSCQDHAGLCPQDWQPVCGCDDKTYATACHAGGVGIKSQGTCPGTPVWCSPSGKSCGGESYCKTSACDPKELGQCTDRSDCTAGGGEVCGCDTKTYADACAAAKAGANVDHQGACKPPKPGQPCGGKTGAQCPISQSCDPLGCGLDVAGICILPPPKVCPEPTTGSQECGCDNKTYATACARQKAGKARQHKGACKVGGDVGTSCGGFSGAKCKIGLFCDPLTCSLGSAGTCQAVPTGKCLIGGNKVCGCDGKTYDSTCERRKATTGKAKEGACTAK